MWRKPQRWGWCGLIVLVTATGAVSAQSFLADQFQLIQPGITLSVVQDYGSEGCPGELLLAGPSFVCTRVYTQSGTAGYASIGGGTDALGNFYQVTWRRIPRTGQLCESGTGVSDVYDIERIGDTGSEVLARVPNCVYLATVGTGPFQITNLTNLAVDSVNGLLLAGVRSSRDDAGGVQRSSGIVRLSGLPTLLDIILSFQPASGTVSWIAPKHPEALPAADRFQVFTGDLRDLPDFGRATPVACSVPDPGSPQPGDFLSILDPLPDPLVGRGRYVIVGVEYAGQRRFGRQLINGVLSGREPSAFAPCN